MSLIDDIAQHLHNQGVGSLGTNLFKSYTPESPDACVTVLDTGGVEPDRDLPTEDPTFQVFIRSSSYAAGKTKLDAVRTALHQQENTQLGLGSSASYFYYIFAIAEGGHLGRDDVGRDIFSINFRCHIR